MRKILGVFLLLTLSFNLFSSPQELNLKGFFEMEGNYKGTSGSVSSQSKIKSGFNIGGNYLFQFDDFKAGPFFSYSLDREQTGVSGPKYSVLSYGVEVSKDLNQKIYIFGGLGLNSFGISGLQQYYASLGYTITVSTEGGMTYLFGGGMHINKDISAEIMYQNSSGKATLFGNINGTEDMTYDRLSFGVSYKIPVN